MFLRPRRTLIKQLFLSVALLVLTRHNAFGASLFETIALVQHDLFPNSKGVPTLSQIYALGYLETVFQQKRVRQEHKDFIRNGAKWLNEEALLQHKKEYVSLTSKERQKILHVISKEQWGENWIHTILTYIYEAMLSDPVYGGNRNEKGWQWLNHTSGLPRPTKAQV